VQRGTERKNLILELPAHWRQSNDISWRATTWDFRRMATGGLVLKDAPEPRQGLGLVVDYVGQYDEHAAGKKAGFKKGDLLTSAGGENKPMNESQFLRYMLQSKMVGEKVPVTVLRSGEQFNLQLPMQ
jgi:S1-C subfamily serine protease